MWKATRSWLVYAFSTPPNRSAVSLTSVYVGYFSPPLNTRCSRKCAIPFSSGRSVRAPASNATSAVSARVPGTSTRWTGSPLVGTVVVAMRAIALPYSTSAAHRGCDLVG